RGMLHSIPMARIRDQKIDELQRLQLQLLWLLASEWPQLQLESGEELQQRLLHTCAELQQRLQSVEWLQRWLRLLRSAVWLQLQPLPWRERCAAPPARPPWLLARAAGPQLLQRSPPWPVLGLWLPRPMHLLRQPDMEATNHLSERTTSTCDKDINSELELKYGFVFDHEVYLINSIDTIEI
ncbi:hypothetical protein LSTR_LSTR005144, partial [Laodelphax striatellus]